MLVATADNANTALYTPHCDNKPHLKWPVCTALSLLFFRATFELNVNFAKIPPSTFPDSRLLRNCCRLPAFAMFSWKVCSTKIRYSRFENVFVVVICLVSNWSQAGPRGGTVRVRCLVSCCRNFLVFLSGNLEEAQVPLLKPRSLLLHEHGEFRLLNTLLLYGDNNLNPRCCCCSIRDFSLARSPFKRISIWQLADSWSIKWKKKDSSLLQQEIWLLVRCWIGFMTNFRRRRHEELKEGAGHVEKHKLLSNSWS